jgi:hypothetical protein
MDCGEQLVARERQLGKAVVVELDREIALRCWCPADLEHLLQRPDDLDDVAASLRWSIAWELDITRLEDLAAAARVDASRISAFMHAPARQAGQLLTLAEAGRLMRHVGLRIADRDLEDQLASCGAIADPLIVAAGLDLNQAAVLAHQAAASYQAASQTSGTAPAG